MRTYPVIRINGINMDDADHRWGIDRSQPFRGLPGLRSTSVVVPGRSGALWPRFDPYEVSRFPLSLIVMGRGANMENRAIDLAETLEALYFILSQSPAQIDLRSSPDRAYQATGRIIAMSEPQNLTEDAVRLDLIYELPDVFWREPDYLETGVGRISLAPETSELTPFRGSTAPIVDAEFFISGPFSEFRLSQAYAGGTYSGFKVSRAIPNGRWCYVNTSTMVATVYDAPDWTGHGGSPVDITTDVDSYGDGTFPGWLTLLPSAADGDPTNKADRKVLAQYVCAGTGAFTPTLGTTLRIRGRQAYL